MISVNYRLLSRFECEEKFCFFYFLTSGYFMSILTICWLENRKFFLSGFVRVRLAIFQVALGCVIMKYIYESTMKLEFSFVVIWVERSVTFISTEPLTRFGIEIMKLKSPCRPYIIATTQKEKSLSTVQHLTGVKFTEIIPKIPIAIKQQTIFAILFYFLHKLAKNPIYTQSRINIKISVSKNGFFSNLNGEHGKQYKNTKCLN